MASRHFTAGVLDAVASVTRPIEAGTEPERLPTIKMRKSSIVLGTAAAVGKFLLHFLEMAIAMGVGMAIFSPFKASLVDQGYTILLDRSSIEYQVWMNLFMVVPMVAWMRVRGHGWHHGLEMGAAMIVPVAIILFVCSLGIEETFPWFTTGLTGLAMFLGMLGYMLYRRDMYTGGYSLGWMRRRRTRT